MGAARRAWDHGGMQESPTDVPIRDEAIRLGQLLKLANIVEDGAHARAVIQGGEVKVDGEIETRRGRQVAVGSVVELAGASFVVVAE